MTLSQGSHIRYPAYWIFILQFTTVAKLQLGGPSTRKVENHCSVWILYMQKQLFLRINSLLGAGRRNQDYHESTNFSFPDYGGSVSHWWVISRPPLFLQSLSHHTVGWASTYKPWMLFCVQKAVAACLPTSSVDLQKATRSSLFRRTEVWPLCSKSDLKPDSF